MKIKENLAKKTQKFILELDEKYNNLAELELKDLDQEKTVFVMMDVLEGFTRTGNLSDDRLKELIPGIKKLMQKFVDNNYEVLAFADAHDENNPEFNSYPKHCLENTLESELVEELKEVGGYTLIKKNSTNGLLAPEFQSWLENNKDKNTYVFVGGCTDICVMQTSLAFKSYFNQLSKNVSIIVVTDLVDTFDLSSHDADIHNLISLSLMENSGIKLVKNIK